VTGLPPKRQAVALGREHRQPHPAAFERGDGGPTLLPLPVVRPLPRAAASTLASLFSPRVLPATPLEFPCSPLCRLSDIRLAPWPVSFPDDVEVPGTGSHPSARKCLLVLAALVVSRGVLLPALHTPCSDPRLPAGLRTGPGRPHGLGGSRLADPGPLPLGSLLCPPARRSPTGRQTDAWTSITIVPNVSAACVSPACVAERPKPWR
jgi:hypothetical protein